MLHYTAPAGAQPRGFARGFARFAKGGMVRGPGTGTSDSVRASVPVGSYIMPADSTAQIGAAQLAGLGSGPRGFTPAGMGGRSAPDVPVRLSNGEYQLPPEQVHAVGARALDAIKDATHQYSPPQGAADQAARGPRGFAPSVPTPEPPLFFADGGPVRGYANGGETDAPKKPRSFGDPAAAANNPGVTVAQAPAATAAPASTPVSAPATAPNPTATPSFSYRDNDDAISSDIASSWNKGDYGAAVGKAVAGTVGHFAIPAIDVVKGFIDPAHK